MRDAESTLDQLISFCGNKIQESDVLSMFGLAARAQLLSLATAIITANATEALRELNELARNGKDLGRLIADLLGHFQFDPIGHSGNKNHSPSSMSSSFDRNASRSACSFSSIEPG